MSVVIWGKDNCAYCKQAVSFCESNNLSYEYREVGQGWTREQLLEAVPNARTVPQIFVNDNLVGTFAEFRKYMEDTGYNGTGYTL
jgi:glutaredoxin